MTRTAKFVTDTHKVTVTINSARRTKRPDDMDRTTAKKCPKADALLEAIEWWITQNATTAPKPADAA